MTDAPIKPKRCECGNKIDPRDLGEGATQCEWCQRPEVPIYKIKELGYKVELWFVGIVGQGVEVTYQDWLSAIAPSMESAQIILDDYLEQQRAKKREHGCFFQTGADGKIKCSCGSELLVTDISFREVGMA